MTRRQRRRKHDRRRNTTRLAAGAGLGITAAFGFAGPAQADVDVLTVNSLADPGDGTCDVTQCTLREAVTQAEDGNDGVDRILFAAGLSGTIALDNEGSISISEPLRIQGPGADVITVSGNDTVTVFGVCCGYDAPVTISGLTVSDSLGSAGAVASSGGTLVLSDMVVENNVSTATGGAAVYAYGGAIEIRNTTITGNTADETGAAVHLILQNTPQAYEGLTVTGSEITGNTSNSGGGGAIYTRNASPLIRNSTLSGNEALGGGRGGAIYASRTSAVVDLTIEDSTLADNTSSGQRGGAIHLASDTTLDLTRSTVTGNNAANGGGGVSGYRVNLESSTLSGNSVDPNGYGGGAVAYDLQVDNSTVSGNSAPGTGGYGGGLLAAGIMRISNSTISGNSAGDFGGGLYKQGGYYGELSNSIVANNTAPTGPDIDGTTFDADFTLVEDDSDATIVDTLPGSNLFGVDPQLGPLADNGGPTLTHRPANGSPAVDAGTAFGVSSDQRGFARPVDQPGIADATAPGADGADMGAVELTLAEVTPPLTDPDPGPSGQPGTDPANTSPKKKKARKCTKKRKRAGKCKKKKKK